MKKNYLFSFTAAVALFYTGLCNAQTAVELKPAPTGITIDGKGKEWGETMAYTSDEKVNYTISNDKDNLYLVIKTKDRLQQSAIAGAGVTLSVDPKGRKKSSYSVTFPAIPEDKDQSSFKNIDPETFASTLNFLDKFGKIKVAGFKDIEDGELPAADNGTGIKTAIGYDEAGNLIYEEAIPLTLFHAPADLMTKEWMFNITINPLQGRGQPMTQTGGTAGVPHKRGGKKSADSGIPDIGKPAGIQLADLTPEVTFWGKFTLAK